MKTSSIVNRAKHLALLLVLLLPAITWSDTLFDPPPARSRNSIAEPTNPGTGVGSIAADFSVSPSGQPPTAFRLRCLRLMVRTTYSLHVQCTTSIDIPASAFGYRIKLKKRRYMNK